MEKKATSVLSPIRIRDRIAKKLGNVASRRRFFRLRGQEEVAQQIRELRERRRFRQIDLARAAKMKQSAISRIEKAGYSAWTYRTLLRIAEALDAQLRIVFEAHEDVIARYEQESSNHGEASINLATENAETPLFDLSKVVNGQMVGLQPTLMASMAGVIGMVSTNSVIGVTGALTARVSTSGANLIADDVNQLVTPYGVPSPPAPPLIQKYAQAHEQEYRI